MSQEPPNEEPSTSSKDPPGEKPELPLHSKASGNAILVSPRQVNP